MSLKKTVEGFKSKGAQHAAVKKVGAMNDQNTTPQQYNNPDMAQAARGNGPVSLPGEQPQALGRSADAGVEGAYQSERMPANIPSIPGF